MEVNEELREQIFEAINNQLKENDPPEVKTTYDRLIKEGFNDFETKQLLGQCLIKEMFDVIESNQPFDEERYVKNLNRLPKEPFD